MIEDSIRHLLVADAAIIGRLGTYEFTTGTATPAVFNYAPAPKDAACKLITISTVDAASWGTMDCRGGELVCDVQVWGNKDTSLVELAELAQDVWQLLDWSVLAVGGYEGWGVFCSPPVFLRDDNGFPGYNIETTARIMEP